MYEWLKDYQELQEEIDYLEYKIEREKRELKRWIYGDLQNVKLHEDSIASKIEERIAAYEKELNHKKDDLQKAEKIISQFKGLENQILYYKYVKGMTLLEVADTLGYSGQYIYNKHAEIMRRIDFAHRLNINLT